MTTNLAKNRSLQQGWKSLVIHSSALSFPPTQRPMRWPMPSAGPELQSFHKPADSAQRYHGAARPQMDENVIDLNVTSRQSRTSDYSSNSAARIKAAVPFGSCGSSVAETVGLSALAAAAVAGVGYSFFCGIQMTGNWAVFQAGIDRLVQ